MGIPADQLGLQAIDRCQVVDHRTCLLAHFLTSNPGPRRSQAGEQRIEKQQGVSEKITHPLLLPWLDQFAWLGVVAASRSASDISVAVSADTIRNRTSPRGNLPAPLAQRWIFSPLPMTQVTVRVFASPSIWIFSPGRHSLVPAASPTPRDPVSRLLGTVRVKRLVWSSLMSCLVVLRGCRGGRSAPVAALRALRAPCRAPRLTICCSLTPPRVDLGKATREGRCRGTSPKPNASRKPRGFGEIRTPACAVARSTSSPTSCAVARSTSWGNATDPSSTCSGAGPAQNR